jgi:hypothetical protein
LGALQASLIGDLIAILLLAAGPVVLTTLPATRRADAR